MPGPVPKRADQKRRNNQPPIPLERVETGDPVPPDADPSWHPLALRWFESLKVSGQNVFYTQTDWEEACVWAEVLSGQLKSGRPSANMMSAWTLAGDRLLTTEGARRRLRIELERAKPKDGERVSHLDELARRRSS